MSLYSFQGISPSLPDSADYWVAPTAHVIGKVVLSEGSSIWFGSTLRGDNEYISVGKGTNVQENCVLHTDIGFPLTIGDGCTIGHKAILHGCTIGDNSLVGMGATVLNGANIGQNCLIGAGALVTEGKEIPAGSLVVGMPAKVVRRLSAAEIDAVKQSAIGYQNNMRAFKDGLRRID